MSEPPDLAPQPDQVSQEPRQQPDALHRGDMYPAYATIPATPLPKPYGWWADIAPRLDESQRNVMPMVIKAYDHLVERQQMEMNALHAEENAMLFARVITNLDLKLNEIPKEERRERTKRTALVFWRAWGAQVDPIYKREQTWADYHDFVHDASFEAIKYLRLSVEDFNEEYDQVLDHQWGVDNHERYEERRRRRNEEHTKQRQEYLQGIGSLQIIPGTQGQGTPLTPHGRSASIPSYTPPTPTQVHRKISNDPDAGSSSEQSFSISGAPRPVKYISRKRNEHLTTLQRDLQTGRRPQDFKTCRRLQGQEAEKLRQQQKLDLAHLPQENDSKFDYAHQRMLEWHQKQKLKIRRKHLQELQVLAEAKNPDQQPKPTSTDPQNPKPSLPSYSNSLKRARSLQGRSATPFSKKARSRGPRYLESDDNEAEISFLHRGPFEDERMVSSGFRSFAAQPSSELRSTGPRREWYMRHSAPAAFAPYAPEPRVGGDKTGPSNSRTVPNSQPPVPAVVITKPAEPGSGWGRPGRNNPSNLTTRTSAGAFTKSSQPGGGLNLGGPRPRVLIGNAGSRRDSKNPRMPSPISRIPSNDQNPEFSSSPGSFFDSPYYASVRKPDRKAAFGSLLRPSSSAAVFSGKQQPDSVSAKFTSSPSNNAERGSGPNSVRFKNTDPFAAPKSSVYGQPAPSLNPPGHVPARTPEHHLSFLSNKPKTSDNCLSLTSRSPARPSTLNANHQPGGATSTFPSSAYVPSTNRQTPKSFVKTKPLDNAESRTKNLGAGPDGPFSPSSSPGIASYDDAPLIGSDSHGDDLDASPDSPFSPRASPRLSSHDNDRFLESDSNQDYPSARPGTTRFSSRPSLRTTSRNGHEVDDLTDSRTPKEVEDPRNMLVASRNARSHNFNAYEGRDGFRDFGPSSAAPERSNVPRSRLMATTRTPSQYGPSSSSFSAHGGRDDIRDLGPSSEAPEKPHVPSPRHTPRRSSSKSIPGPNLASPHAFPQYERNPGMPTEPTLPNVEVSRPGSLKRPHPDLSPSHLDNWRGRLFGRFSSLSGYFTPKSKASATQIPVQSRPGLSDDRTGRDLPFKRRRLNTPMVDYEPTNGTKKFGGNESAATPATDPSIEVYRRSLFEAIQRCRRENRLSAERCNYWESQVDKADSADAMKRVWFSLKSRIPTVEYNIPSKQKTTESPRPILRASSTRERMRKIVEETQMTDNECANWLRQLNDADTPERLRGWKSRFYKTYPNYNPKVNVTTPSGKRDREGQPLNPFVPYPTPKTSSKPTSQRTPSKFVVRVPYTPQSFAKKDRHLDPRTAIESGKRGSGTLPLSNRFPRRETPKVTDTSQFDRFLLGARQEANKDGTQDASGKKPSHVPKDTGKQQRPPAKRPRSRALNSTTPRNTGGTGSSDSGSDTSGPEFVDPDKRKAPTSEDDGWETPSEGSSSGIFGGSGEDDDDGARDYDWEPDMPNGTVEEEEEGDDQEKKGNDEDEGEEKYDIEEETDIEEENDVDEETDIGEEEDSDDQEEKTDDEDEDEVFNDDDDEEREGGPGKPVSISSSRSSSEYIESGDEAAGGQNDAGNTSAEHGNGGGRRKQKTAKKPDEEDDNDDETLSRLDVGSRFLGSDDEYNDLFEEEEDNDKDDDEPNASESSDYGSSSSSSSNSPADRSKRRHSSTSSSNSSASSKSEEEEEEEEAPDALPSYLKLGLQRYITYWTLHGAVAPAQSAEWTRRLAKCNGEGYADVEEDVIEQLLERQLERLRDADPDRHAWLAQMVADEWVPGVGGKHDWTRFVEAPCDTRNGGCDVCGEKVKDGITVSSFYGGPG